MKILKEFWDKWDSEILLLLQLSSLCIFLILLVIVASYYSLQPQFQCIDNVKYVTKIWHHSSFTMLMDANGKPITCVPGE